MGRWAWLAWGLPAALVFFLALREIGAVDFPWQLATGRLIAEEGIPAVDPWLTTAEPRPWIEVRWLYCLALFGLVESVGSWAATVACAFLYAGATVFVLRASNRCSTDWLLATGVLAAIVMGRRLSVRPEVTSALLFALALFLVIRMREGKLNLRTGVPILILSQILWANLHGLFALNLVVCAAWVLVEFCSRSSRRVAALVALLGVSFASLVNPYGVQGALFPLTLFSELGSGPYPHHIIELRSPFYFGFTPSLIALLGLAVLVGWSAVKRRGDCVALLVAGCCLALALSTVRNGPLFAIAAAAYLSSCPFRPQIHVRAVAAGTAVAFAYIFGIGTWTLEDRLGLGVNERRLPLEAAAQLVEAGVPDPVFNTLAEGAALLYHGSKVFADPRLEVLPPERFEQMLRISRCQEPLPSSFQSVLVSADSALVAELINGGGWRLVAMDRVALGFVREEGAMVSIADLRSRLWSVLPENPKAFSWFRKSLSPVPFERMETLFRNIGDEETATRLDHLARHVYPAR